MCSLLVRLINNFQFKIYLYFFCCEMVWRVRVFCSLHFVLKFVSVSQIQKLKKILQMFFQEISICQTFVQKCYKYFSLYKNVQLTSNAFT